MSFNSVNTNVQSFAALQTLRVAQAGVTDSSKRLQTGYRVADASDDAGVFSVAQGLRGELAALDEVVRVNAFARETVSVARRAVEEMSGVIQEINKKVLVLRSGPGDPDEVAALQNDINGAIARIDRLAQGSALNGVNLLTQTDPLSAWTFVPDGGSTTVTTTAAPTSTVTLSGAVSGNAPASLTFAAPAYNPALTNPRIVVSGSALFDANPISVSFSGGNVAYSSNGSFTATIPDTGGSRTVSIAIGDGGLPSNGYQITSVTYVYDTGPPVTTTTSVPTGSWVEPDPNAGSFKIINDASGATATSVRYMDLTAAGLGLSNPVYDPLDSLRQAVSDAQGKIEAALQHFAAKEKEIGGVIDGIQARSDALRAGLGASVDSDIGKASAEIEARKAREQLALQGVSIANRSHRAILGYLENGR